MIGKGVGLRMNKILDIKNYSMTFIGEKQKKVLTNINLSINKGEIIALVGDSGCGKTTLGRSIIDFFNINGDAHKKFGKIIYYHKNEALSIFSNEYRRKFKVPPIQMIFQDPKTSLNLKMNIKKQLYESMSDKKNSFIRDILVGVNIHDLEYLLSITDKFKLNEEILSKIPKNISGGQRRRVGIAKIILALGRSKNINKIIIADEPVASLDASIKLDVMKRLIELKNDGYTIIIISHDISLITRHADKICVMSKLDSKGDNGVIVEELNPKLGLNPITPEGIKLFEVSAKLNKYLNVIDSN
jgi:ABC-type dipeptide/oligopeptide/nickel transport system ATPase subunit